MNRYYSKEYLIQVAQEHRTHFYSHKHWRIYAREHQLPSVDAFIRRFGTWKKAKIQAGIEEEPNKKPSVNKEEFLSILKDHLQEITTQSNWDDYAAENQLPTSKTITNVLGKWTEVKTMLDLTVRGHTGKHYTKEELTDIALKHKGYFTKVEVWKEYAQKNQLPSFDTYKRAFGSWNKAKETIGLATTTRNKEKLKEIALKHQKHFSTIEIWNNHAKENKLPSSNVFISIFGNWNEAKEEIGLSISKKGANKYSVTDEELIFIGEENIEFFTSVNVWDLHAKENNLPLSNVYIRRFGTWSNAKELIY